MRQALRVCGGGIVGVDVAWDGEPLTRIAVGSPFGSPSLARRRCSTLQAREERRSAGMLRWNSTRWR
jgi:hypothetical protein